MCQDVNKSWMLWDSAAVLAALPDWPVWPRACGYPSPGAGFGFAPAFPVAALENLGVIKAIQRGDALSKGKHGRIALLYIMNLVLVVAGVFGLIRGLGALQDSFGKAWFIRPVYPLSLWLILLVPQFYMVALTVNYFDMRHRSEARSAG